MIPIVDSLSMAAFFSGFGPTELLIILAIVLLIFGPKKLPEMGKAIGQSIRELRKAGSSEEDTTKKEKQNDQE